MRQGQVKRGCTESKRIVIFSGLIICLGISRNIEGALPEAMEMAIQDNFA